MATDFHPIIVHFPIALLSLYSMFEIISVRKLREKPYWFFVKAILISLGTLSSMGAIISGLLSPNFTRGVPLNDTHLYFAIGTTLFFTLISIPYMLAWFGRPREVIWSSKIVFNRRLMIPLAVVGLIAITITGGLGGAIVYGTGFNPIMNPIFKLLNL
jgi:uncharacterized membrane protein